MNKTLRVQTEERKSFLKNLIIGVLKDDNETEGRSVGQMMTELGQENIDFDYNRVIVGNILGELETVRMVFQRSGNFFWDHGRGLCHQEDVMGKCQCCGDKMGFENGSLRCPTCR